MPGIAHWPSRIQPMSRTKELAATYDIFPTILKLADAQIPNDRVIDGRDLSTILFDKNNEGKSLHECLYIYGGTPGAGKVNGDECNGDFKKCPGLYALRCGAFKMAWVTMNANDSSHPTIHDPPLLFNVNHDPSEKHPIWPDDNAYAGLRSYFEDKKRDHEATYIAVPNYILMGADEKYQVCCDWNSTNQYPQYPECTCTPVNWNQSTCSPTCEATSTCGATGIDMGFIDDQGNFVYSQSNPH